MIDTSIKQVIVMRNDLNMRKGKMIAQGAHASIMFTLDFGLGDLFPSQLQLTWMTHGMTKICVRCDSEEQLMDIYRQAKEAKLTVHLVRDAGLTEFTEPTYTCLAIGPNKAEDIDKITGELKLL
jgi:PTH2 family peptidyl-tRNA hydrolase